MPAIGDRISASLRCSIAVSKAAFAWSCRALAEDTASLALLKAASDASKRLCGITFSSSSSVARRYSFSAWSNWASACRITACAAASAACACLTPSAKFVPSNFITTSPALTRSPISTRTRFTGPATLGLSGIVSRAFRVPMPLISLVNSCRTTVAIVTGKALSTTSMSTSFCRYFLETWKTKSAITAAATAIEIYAPLRFIWQTPFP